MPNLTIDQLRDARRRLEARLRSDISAALESFKAETDMSTLSCFHSSGSARARRRFSTGSPCD